MGQTKLFYRQLRPCHNTSRNPWRKFVWKITWPAIKDQKDKLPRLHRVLVLLLKALADLELLRNQLLLLASPPLRQLSEPLRRQQVVYLVMLQLPRPLEAYLEHPLLLLPLASLHPLKHSELLRRRQAVCLLPRQLEACLELLLLLLPLVSLHLPQLLELLRRLQVVSLVHPLPCQLEACSQLLLPLLPLVSLHLPQLLELLRRRQVVSLVHLPQLQEDFLERRLLLPLVDYLASLPQPQPHLCLASLFQLWRREGCLAPQHPRNQADFLAHLRLLLEVFLVKGKHLLREGCLVPF